MKPMIPKMSLDFFMAGAKWSNSEISANFAAYFASLF